MTQGLNKIWPHAKDYSLLHSFGDTLDVQSLPASFSVYGGQAIPDQNIYDFRFNPPVRPLPYGCTGESGAFAVGLEDGVLARPDDLYDATPGVDGQGRDIRDMLKVLVNRGVKLADGTMSKKRTAFFNCYGAGKIDDFDAARLGLYLNQQEHQPVIVGTWFYWPYSQNGMLQTPSFNIKDATLHCYIITGWTQDYLEIIPWCGTEWGDKGIGYYNRETYNALMQQPYTGAFRVTGLPSDTPVPIGYQAWVDHVVYFIRNLFGV